MSPVCIIASACVNDNSKTSISSPSCSKPPPEPTRYGLTTGDLEEATMKRAISQQAAETIVLASSEKLDKVSPYKIGSLSSVSALILSGASADSLLASYENFGITLIRA
ncbi:hypothetical protein [Thiothrix eikelboomii]|uniref:hypothetical protein n=1 Tax=Thiothrix eikelboomii TaxID=92487 RepID=UPI003BAF2ECB